MSILEPGKLKSNEKSEDPLKIPAFFGIFFAFTGILLAGLLVCKHTTPDLCTATLGCGLDSGIDGCRELGKSSHSKILPGIPIALTGFFYYLLTALMFFQFSKETNSDRRNGLLNMLLALTLFGNIINAALFYKNFFVLKHPCLLCTYSYISGLGILLIALLLFFKNKRELGNGRNLLQAMKKSIFSLGPALVMTILLPFLLGGAEGLKSDGTEGEYHDNLLPAKKVSSFLEEFRALKSAKVAVAHLDNIEGEESAYISIHKFADFRCGHCFQAGLLLREAQHRWPGRIRIYFRHFPLDGTCNPAMRRKQPGAWSCNGAQAALCSAEQGIFVKMYHEIFSFQLTETHITLNNLNKLTQKLGGNWSKMVSCMGSKKTAIRLNRDIQVALKLGIESTPTLVIQNKLIPPGIPDRLFFLHVMDALVFEKEGEAAYNDYRKRISGSR